MEKGINFNLPLQGTHVRLEPLGFHHAEGLLQAATVDPSLYALTFVPTTPTAMETYIKASLNGRDNGTATPFAIVRLQDNMIVGCTSFFQIESWAWPVGHPRHDQPYPDVAELGATWLGAMAIRTPINTECKLLMLTHAFETMQMLRVCLHTDARNTRSKNAILRIGGKLEGTLRAHRMSSEFTPRDSLRFSIIKEEWPEVKQKLNGYLSSIHP